MKNLQAPLEQFWSENFRYIRLFSRVSNFSLVSFTKHHSQSSCQKLKWFNQFTYVTSSGKSCRSLSIQRISNREKSQGRWNHLIWSSSSHYSRADAQPEKLSHSHFRIQLTCHLPWEAFPDSTRQTWMPSPLCLQRSLHVHLRHHLPHCTVISVSPRGLMNSLIVFHFFN